MIQQLILTSQKVLRTGLRFRLGRAGSCLDERLYPAELLLALPSLREIVIVRLLLIRSKLTITPIMRSRRRAIADKKRPPGAFDTVIQPATSTKRPRD